MASEASQLSAPVAATEEIDLLDQIVEKSKVAKSRTEHERAKDIISALAQEVMDGTVVVSDNLNLTWTRVSPRLTGSSPSSSAR